MARRHQTEGSSHVNGDRPPPSTFAAQLVQNQTRQDASQHQNGDGATFTGLLHEILYNPAAVPETDVNVNAQLISVVIEAGLAVLTQDNPFAQWNLLIPQAQDSMAVIEATIRRQPQILLSRSNSDGPQLFLWLLAKLISVSGHPKCLDLPIAPLLDSMIYALRDRLGLLTQAEMLRQTLKDCVEDMIAALDIVPNDQMSLNLRLPPARSITNLWTQAEGVIVIPPELQTTIQSPIQTFVSAQLMACTPSLRGIWAEEVQLRLCPIFESVKSRLQKMGLIDQVVQSVLQKGSTKSQITLIYNVLSNIDCNFPSKSTQGHISVSLRQTRNRPNAHEQGALCLAVLAGLKAQRFDDLDETLKEDLMRWDDWSHCDLEPNRNSRKPLALTRYQAVAVNDTYKNDDRHTVLGTEEYPVSRARKRRKFRDIDNIDIAFTDDGPNGLQTVESNYTNLDTTLGISRAEYRALDENQRYQVWVNLAILTATKTQMATKVIVNLASSSEEESKSCRIQAMLTTERCLEHIKDDVLLDLTADQFGPLCLRSLQSSIRELRLAAMRCITQFLRPNLKRDTLQRNRQIILELIHTLSGRNVESEDETIIGLWGKITLTCADEEMNLALLSLIDYLGHTNPYVCGLAFQELEAVSMSKNTTIDSMINPFRRSVAISIVQDLLRKPQKAQQFCDLLQTDVNTLLMETQRDTVPVLVLTRRRDVLQRIAVLRGPNAKVQDVCLQPPANLASTISYLLFQPSTDVEDAVMACLGEVAPELEGSDLSTLVKADSTLIAVEMLKLAAEASAQRKSRAYQAFQTFANLAEREPGKRKAHSNAAKTVTEFLEKHILGILTHLSAFLESGNNRSSVEKTLHLKALTEMIQIARTNCGIALPQIRACLQSATDQPHLCENAFHAWLVLLSVLNSEDIAAVIDQVFAVTVQHWDILSPEMQQEIHEAIAKVIREHNSVFRDHVSTLPSLASIPLLSKFAAEFERLKAAESVESLCRAFTRRLLDESNSVSSQAIKELVPFLEEYQDFIHETASSEQPSPVITGLLRALLDTTSKTATDELGMEELFGKCLGLFGCLDANRIDVTNSKHDVLVLSNFDKATEVVDWVCTLLEEVLVKAFRSESNARAQGFLAYVMQELLRFCGFNDAQGLRLRPSQSRPTLQRWYDIPEPIRITLTPFLSSRYLLTSNVASIGSNRGYPGFQVDAGHSVWLRGLVFDLMLKAKGDNPKMVFPLLAKLIRGHDISISRFLLPYALLNVVLEGTVAEVEAISEELLAVLKAESQTNSQQETIKQCSETVFGVLDYMSLWLQEKRKMLEETRAAAYRTGHSPQEFDEVKDMHQISNLEKFLATVPAEVIAARAVDCRSYARALFHWEHFIRQKRPLIPSMTTSSNDDFLYDRLQEIYAHIDDPDGLEGIASHLAFVSEDQQAVQHARAGRWTAAQAWYEVQLTASNAHHPVDFKVALLECLRETGQHAALLRYTSAFSRLEKQNDDSLANKTKLASFAVESLWTIGDMNGLEACLQALSKDRTNDFNVGIGKILVAASKKNQEEFADQIKMLRKSSIANLTTTGVNSLQVCHQDLRKLHVLQEIEALWRCNGDEVTVGRLSASLDKRLAAVGSYISDKQYILGARRAIMGLQINPTVRAQTAGAWLTTARLARKAGNTSSAHHAVLQAYKCGERAAKLEEARLLWHDGHRRQAIQSLESAITSKVFEIPELMENLEQTESTSRAREDRMLAAKAQLLLAKWLDAAGQNKAKEMTTRYQMAAKTFQRWEKGHYYLGKHYCKILDAEKALPKEKQGPLLTTGELTKLVVENLLRSVPWGSKYWHESIPKLLTLWLDLGLQCLQKQPREDSSIFEKRLQSLQDCHRQLLKYFDRRIQPYVFYNAMPQIISRISHPHPDVWKQLCVILTRIGACHPNQALWSLLAVAKARDRLRAERGAEILAKLKDPKTKTRDASNNDLKLMITHGQRLSDGLLHACEAHVEPRASKVNLYRDLGFNQKLAPSSLVVPVEVTLTPSLPNHPTADRIRRHKAFAQEKITIQSFLDEVAVLSSLQRPRKITVRGSDGKLYGILCKPKDDLRKDQRLMEFNGMINRALKRDADSSKRGLYIKTYAVTPLSEESGIIEWVEGIKPIRDILLNLYYRKGIKPNYNDIRNTLNEACKGPEHAHIFVDKILSTFKPALHEWFTETFAEPEAWFAARLKYARSAAVMSMTGHMLGLGDRHGENILLQEGTGGVFHVDFNCLFDKGLTFEKPEVVPFRLTPNMVDAMGPHGYDGPFRKSSELTLQLLRQNKDTLMTILETFLYDPTTDFIGGKKKRSTAGVPETPQEILDSVDGKLKGLLRGETMPLSVEGYVDALIRQAVDPYNLAQMYIGWCSFL
ncbi:hypothetical protein K431DRAFT_261173 [Polychaeton citri CBS 116435]|uniref:non-specific serine/threonine protein kinase n=1 Tax=Polychaeton citri CBS 116435 TaxID=1314669 RepID=A0A9P4UTN1_9PEZI|nr:hypothetical protein K431DRAFT_261173 [Polychaeton citri CBS 116435]